MDLLSTISYACCILWFTLPLAPWTTNSHGLTSNLSPTLTESDTSQKWVRFSIRAPGPVAFIAVSTTIVLLSKNTDKLSLVLSSDCLCIPENINWFALLCLDYKRTDDSEFLINWVSFCGLLHLSQSQQLFPCVMKNTDKLSLKQWLSLYSGKYNINWFALLCLDHKRSDDSGFLINWMSSFGCICCCVIQKIVAYAFLLYIDFKSIDISKKVLVTVGCVIKTVSVTCLLFPMLFIIAWRVLPLLPTIVVR